MIINVQLSCTVYPYLTERLLTKLDFSHERSMVEAILNSETYLADKFISQTVWRRIATTLLIWYGSGRCSVNSDALTGNCCQWEPFFNGSNFTFNLGTVGTLLF